MVLSARPCVSIGSAALVHIQREARFLIYRAIPHAQAGVLLVGRRRYGETLHVVYAVQADCGIE